MQPIYLIEAIFEKAQAHYLHNDFPATIQLLKGVLAPLDDARPPLKGQVLFLLAKSYFATTQYREARKVADKACRFFKSNAMIAEAAQCYQLLGQIFSEQGRYTEAIQEFQQGLNLFSVHQLTLTELTCKASLHLSLGQTAIEIFQTELQHTHFIRCLFISRTIDDQSLYAQSLLGLGNCFYQQRKFSFARQVLLKAIASFHQADDLRGIALSLHTLGQVYTYTFDYRKAVNAFKYAYTLFQHLADQIHEASSLAHLGRIFVRIDPETAEKILRNVTDLLISQTSTHSQRQAELILGRYSITMGLYYEKSGKIDLARSLIKEGMDIFAKYHSVAEYTEAREIFHNLKTLEIPNKPKKNNILAFKLGIIS